METHIMSDSLGRIGSSFSARPILYEHSLGCHQYPSWLVELSARHRYMLLTIRSSSIQITMVFSWVVAWQILFPNGI